MNAPLPLSEADLTEQAQAFAASITGARERWEYCLAASHHEYIAQDRRKLLRPNPRSMATAASVLGRNKRVAESGFRKLRILDWDEAMEFQEEQVAKRPSLYALIGAQFDVGPLKAWCIGHVYFARVEGFEHVVKVGFSRRVHERIEDIESANRVKLIVQPDQLKVGTLLDEQWWHRDWHNFNIAGEWFFDPASSARSLPAFLQIAREAA